MSKQRQASNAVLLVSGGMDSVTLLHYLRRQRPNAHLHALTFLYGQKHARETRCAARHARLISARHQLLKIAFFSQITAGFSALTDRHIAIPALAKLTSAQRAQPATYVPNRNMLLLSLAAAYAEAHGIPEVFYGAQQQDQYGYWDCTNEFLQRLNMVLALNRRQPVVVRAPFLKMRKCEILKIGLKLGIDYARTWTCYKGGRAPCGQCPACAERQQAFAALNLTDPLIQSR